MDENVRLDKYLSRSGQYSRSEAKKLISAGGVQCGGVTVKDAAFKLLPKTVVTVNGAVYTSDEFVYIMLNKPKGVVSASAGENDVTVVDILPEEFKRRGLFPAGRLDRDTTGFCLITDDGAFAHRILSPVSHVPKTYVAVLERPLDFPAAKEAFEKGIVLPDGTGFRSASLTLLSDGGNPVCEVVLSEGKYHQIKRMFKSLGNCVIELKRTAIGGLTLDPTLSEGKCRYLTDTDIAKIYKNTIVENHQY